MEGQFLQIQNNLAQIVDFRVIRQGRLEDIAPHLEVGNNFSLPTVPRTAVFASLNIEDGTQTLAFLSEIPPGRKNLVKRQRDGRFFRYRLAMPWTYMWTTWQSRNGRNWSSMEYRIFHALNRYSGPNDEMIAALLPNVYANGNICWGATGADANQSIGDRVDDLTNNWYLTRFNTDLDGEHGLPWGEPNYGRWVRESRENIDCWRSWPEWERAPKYTVNGLLNGEGFQSRLERQTVQGAIPEIPAPLTFGRADETMAALTPEQQAILFLALQNNGITADNLPAIDTATENTGANPVTPDDDGGELIEG